MKFTSKGRQYEYDENIGYVRQIDAKPYVYDATYSATYDTQAYLQASEKLMALRLGFVIGAHGSVPDSILDMGYGAGQFMKACRESGIIKRVEGFDITGVPVPEGCFFSESVPGQPLITWNKGVTKVVTFWDCFEHIPDEDLEHLLSQFLSAGYTVCISLPNCDIRAKGLDWFEKDYPHLKPDEHLRHFDELSLGKFMHFRGFKTVAVSFHEDIVRKRYHKNILTMAFK